MISTIYNNKYVLPSIPKLVGELVWPSTVAVWHQAGIADDAGVIPRQFFHFRS